MDKHDRQSTNSYMIETPKKKKKHEEKKKKKKSRVECTVEKLFDNQWFSSKYL